MEASASLLDRLTPMVTRTLGILDVLRATGTHPTSAGDIYRELFNSLRHFRDGALRAGKPETETYNAIFAVAAWADEALGRHTPWCADVTALTATLFKSSDPAAEFMARLNSLTDAQNESREVFLIVLGLGYAGGAAASDPARARELGRAKMQLAARVRPPPLPAGKVNALGLTPEVYDVPGTPAYAPPKSGSGRLVRVAALGGALLVGAGIAAWALFGPDGDSRPDRVAAPVVAPENEVLALLLAGFDCARVSVSQGEGGSIALSGFVASEVDLRGLVTSVASLDDVGDVNSTVLVRPWPFCAALSLLVDHGADPAGIGSSGAPPVIERAAATDRLVEGAPVMMTVTASPDFDGYLYVDYFDAEGGVIHLLPEPLHPDNIVYSAEAVPVGMDPSQAGINDRIWRVTPPLGTRMVVALSSPVPLFADFRPVEEGADDYLDALGDALETTRALGGAVAFPGASLFIETVPAAGG